MLESTVGRPGGWKNNIKMNWVVLAEERSN